MRRVIGTGEMGLIHGFADGWGLELDSSGFAEFEA